MIVQLEEAKYKLLGLEEAVKELASAIKIDKLNAKIAELEEQTTAAGFWEMEGSGKILQELKRAILTQLKSLFMLATFINHINIDTCNVFATFSGTKINPIF